MPHERFLSQHREREILSSHKSVSRVTVASHAPALNTIFLLVESNHVGQGREGFLVNFSRMSYIAIDAILYNAFVFGLDCLRLLVGNF